jgi:hypothetical protein
MAFIDQFLLVLEVVVERRLGDVQCLRDFIEGDVFVAPPSEGPRSLGDNRLPFELILLIRGMNGVVPTRAGGLGSLAWRRRALCSWGGSLWEYS